MKSPTVERLINNMPKPVAEKTDAYADKIANKNKTMTDKNKTPTELETQQAELIDLLIGQLIDITVVSKIELGDDVLAEIARLTKRIDNLTRTEKN